MEYFFMGHPVQSKMTTLTHSFGGDKIKPDLERWRLLKFDKRILLHKGSFQKKTVINMEFSQLWKKTIIFFYGIKMLFRHFTKSKVSDFRIIDLQFQPRNYCTVHSMYGSHSGV